MIKKFYYIKVDGRSFCEFFSIELENPVKQQDEKEASADTI